MSFILALASIWALGAFFMLMVIRCQRQGFSVLEFTSLSFLLGVGFASYQLFIYYLAGISFSFVNIAAIPFILFVLIAASSAAKPSMLKGFFQDEARKEKWGMLEKLLALGVLIQVLWIVFLVIPAPVNGHDALANYALKAKIFYLEGGVPEGFFSWSEAEVAHPDYPVLVPFLLTWIYSFTGFNDLHITLIMPVIYLSFIALVYAQIKRLFARKYALLLAFFLATVPQLADYATVIHADLVLTAFITCALIYFILYVRAKRTAYLVLSALLFGFSLWIKNEAFVFVGSFAVVLTALTLRRKGPEKKEAFLGMISSFIIIALVAAPWLCVKLLNASGNSDIAFSLLTPERLMQNVKDIPILLNFFQQEVFGPKKWNIFWMMVFASMIWKRKALLRGENFYITLFLTLSAAGYFLGYMATTGNNLYFYVNTTISRFMLHFTGAALLLMALLVKEDVYELEAFSERRTQ